MYVRRWQERELTFLVSGRLWRDALVMVDEETGSLWSQITGEAFRGEASGATLEVYPYTLTSWEEWREAHPDTRVLYKPADRRETASDYARYFADPGRLGIFGRRVEDRGLPPKTIVVAVRAGDASRVYPRDRLPSEGVVLDRLGGRSVALVSPGDGSVFALVAEVEGEPVRLRLDGGRLLAVDGGVGGPWDPRTGTALEDGPSLSALPMHVVYWFAWQSFHPDAGIWKGE